jgi:hypothetical protein
VKIPRNDRGRGSIILISLAASFIGCRSSGTGLTPAVSFSLVPVANRGTPDSLEPVQGHVVGAEPGRRVVLYSLADGGTWWVQPFASKPFTNIRPDSTWQTSIHLGEQYAAILAEDSYIPAKTLQRLPAVGAGVVAVASVPGAPYHPKIIRFSGYDWEVRQISDTRGGRLNPYDPANAWVDPEGHLHLAVTRRDDRYEVSPAVWACADAGLTQSLGPGSYTFTVRDVSQLDPAAAMTMYTWEQGVRSNREIDVEISRWGNAGSKNAQFVIQPYHEPSNVSRFEAPPGIVSFSFRWEAGIAAFRAVRGRAGGKSTAVAEHSFASGVPSPGGGKIHIDLYAFGKAPVPMKNPAEVIVESFTYAP